MSFEFLKNIPKGSLPKGFFVNPSFRQDYSLISSSVNINFGIMDSKELLPDTKGLNNQSLHPPLEIQKVPTTTSRAKTFLNLGNLKNSPVEKAVSRPKSKKRENFWQHLLSLKFEFFDQCTPDKKGNLSAVSNKERRESQKKSSRENEIKYNIDWHIFPQIFTHRTGEALFRMLPGYGIPEVDYNQKVGFWENLSKSAGLARFTKSMTSQRLNQERVPRPFLYSFSDIILQRIDKEIEAERMRMKARESKQRRAITLKVGTLTFENQMLNIAADKVFDIWEQVWEKKHIKDTKISHNSESWIMKYFRNQVETGSLKKGRAPGHFFLASQSIKETLEQGGFFKPKKPVKGAIQKLLEMADSDMEMLEFTPYVATLPWHTGPRAFLSKMFPRYGNYCGPNWSGGKDGGDAIWDKRPIDWLDYCCYCHDMCYDTHNQAQLLQADLAFLKCLEKKRSSKNRPVTEAYRTMCITGLRNILIPYRHFLVQQQMEVKRMLTSTGIVRM